MTTIRRLEIKKSFCEVILFEATARECRRLIVAVSYVLSTV